MVKDIICLLLSFVISLIIRIQYLLHPIQHGKVTIWKVINRQKGKLQFLNENIFLCKFLRSESIETVLEKDLLVLDYTPEKVVLVKCPGDIYNMDKYPFLFEALAVEPKEKLVAPYSCFLDCIDSQPWPQIKLLFLWSTGRCGSTVLGNLLTSFDGVYTIAEACDVFNVTRIKEKVTDADYAKNFRVAIKYHLIQMSKRYKDIKTLVIKTKSMDFWYINKMPLEVQNLSTHIFMYRDVESTLKSYQGPFGGGPNMDSCLGKLMNFAEIADEAMTPLEDAVSELGCKEMAVEIGRLRKSCNKPLARILFGGLPLLYVLYKNLVESNMFGSKLFAVKYERLRSDPQSYFKAIGRRCGLLNSTEMSYRELERFEKVWGKDSQQNSTREIRKYTNGPMSKEVRDIFDEMISICKLEDAMETGYLLPETL